jgi:hypothetical protein
MLTLELRVAGVAAAILVAGFLAQSYSTMIAADPVKKQLISIDQLNREFIVVGIVGAPIGELVRITGSLVEIQEKPGLHLQIDSVNGKPSDKIVPTQLIAGELPTRRLDEPFSFTARSTLEFHMPSEKFNPYHGYYSRLQIVTSDE